MITQYPYRRYVGRLCTIAIAMQFGTAIFLAQPVAAPQKSDTEVLAEIREARAAVFAENNSGRGVAELHCTERTEPENPIASGVPVTRVQDKHRVEFVFSGFESLLRGEEDFLGNLATLIRDGKMIRYQIVAPGNPPSARVTIAGPGVEDVYPLSLRDWSFQNIAAIPWIVMPKQIPNPLLDDSADFNVIMQRHIGVEQKPGSKVQVVMGPEFEMEFDLSHGGMLTRFHRVWPTGWGDEIRIDWKLTWKKVDGHIVPDTRVIERVLKQNGMVRTGKMEINFQSLRFEQIDRNKEITADQMGIPEGTPLRDGAVNWYGQIGQLGCSVR